MAEDLHKPPLPLVSYHFSGLTSQGHCESNMGENYTCHPMLLLEGQDTHMLDALKMIEKDACDYVPTPGICESYFVRTRAHTHTASCSSSQPFYFTSFQTDH